MRARPSASSRSARPRRSPGTSSGRSRRVRSRAWSARSPSSSRKRRCSPIAALVIWRLAARAPTPAWGPPPALRRPVVADLSAGFDEVRRAPLLGLIAVVYVLLAVLLFFVTFPFLEAAEAAFPNEVALAAAIGTISAIVTAASFVVSLAVAGRFYTRFGVASAALLLPLVYLARVRRLDRVLRLRDRSARPGDGPGHAARPFERRVERVLQHRPRSPARAGDGLPGWRAGPARHDPVRRPAADGGEGHGAGAGVLARRDRRGGRGRDRGRDPTALRPSLLATLRRGIGEQVLEGGPGLGSLESAPDVRAVLDDGTGRPGSARPRDGRPAPRRRAGRRHARRSARGAR